MALNNRRRNCFEMQLPYSKAHYKGTYVIVPNKQFANLSNFEQRFISHIQMLEGFSCGQLRLC